MAWGVLTIDDGSGLSRPEKHAALYRLQCGRCAICGGDFPSKKLLGDHDHQTGLLRGLLCRPCNLVEGRTKSAGTARPAFDAYRANPPAASLGWMWEDPDPPDLPDEVISAILEGTVLPEVRNG
jgi:hypothetical protein